MIRGPCNFNSLMKFHHKAHGYFFFLASPDHARTCTCMYANVPDQDQPGLWLVRVGSCMYIYVYMSADLALIEYDLLDVRDSWAVC